MDKKKIWDLVEVNLINKVADDGKSIKKGVGFSYVSRFEATEEEVKELLETDCNPPCIQDPERNYDYRRYFYVEADTTLDSIEDIKNFLAGRGYYRPKRPWEK